MKTILLLVFAVVSGTTVLAQDVKSIDARVNAIDKMLRANKLKASSYQTPKSTEPTDGDAPEGGDYIERAILYRSGAEAVLAVYTFMGNYITTTDSIWLQNDIPVHARSRQDDLSTDRVVQFKLWLRNETAVQCLANDPESDDPAELNIEQSDVAQRVDWMISKLSRVMELIK